MKMLTALGRKYDEQNWTTTVSGDDGILADFPIPPGDMTGAQVKSPEARQDETGTFRLSAEEHAAHGGKQSSSLALSVIDVHTHLSFRAKPVNGVGIAMRWTFLRLRRRLCRNGPQERRMMVNLTGGAGTGLEKAIESFKDLIPTDL